LDALFRALTTFKLEGEVTSLSESSQGEVGDNREKWGDFWELIAINRNIVSRPRAHRLTVSKIHIEFII
jgi:hypothetical protein